MDHSGQGRLLKQKCHFTSAVVKWHEGQETHPEADSPPAATNRQFEQALAALAFF